MSNFWNKPTAQDLMSRLSEGELNAIQALQVAPNQIEKILDRAVRSARGKIKRGGNQLGPDCTIPDSIADEILSIALWLFVTSVPKLEKLQTDGRKQNYKDAMEVMRDVSTGKQRVELPDAGDPADSVSAPVNAIAVVRTGRHVRTDQFDKGGTT